MPKTAAFDQFSDDYDQWFEENRDLYEAELEAIRQLLPPAGAEGMEVGVGSGKFAVPLGIKIGVEPSEEMANKARNQGIHVYPGIAEDLPFPDGGFDFVLMVTTICFVDDVGQSFREAFRVLKPDGCIIVGFVDSQSELGGLYAETRKESQFYRDATFFSATEVLTHLEDAGFRTIKINQTLVPGLSPAVICDGFGKGAFVAIKAQKAGLNPE